MWITKLSRPLGSMCTLTSRRFDTPAIFADSIKLCTRTTALHTSAFILSEDKPSSLELNEGEEDTPDQRHKKFCKEFTQSLESAIKAEEWEPKPTSDADKAADKMLADALMGLFNREKIVATQTLVEKRNKLRDNYPEIFGRITDEEIENSYACNKEPNNEEPDNEEPNKN